MRLAILSDTHGNPLALDAVLADIQIRGEADRYWVLGDFAALGYDPVTPLETRPPCLMPVSPVAIRTAMW